MDNNRASCNCMFIGSVKGSQIGKWGAVFQECRHDDAPNSSLKAISSHGTEEVCG